MKARGGAATTALALVLALVLGACGSGEGSTSAFSPSVPAVREEGPRVVPLKVSGGGVAQFRAKGGDNSVINYGVEAGRDELLQAARITHGYFAALATEAWKRACSYLSHEQKRQLGALAAASPRLGSKSCRSVLTALFGKVSVAESHEATIVDAATLRQKGKRGFLIYRGAGGKPYVISLIREGEGWTVAGLSPTGLG
jgi:hypothetical protein